MRDYILPIIIAILGSGGFATLVTGLIGARQRKKDKDDVIIKKLDDISNTVDEQKRATEERFIGLDRSRIISFADEISRKIQHSSEAFDDVLECIDRYERYCATHANYKNSKATISAKLITDTYKTCKAEHKFL